MAQTNSDTQRRLVAGILECYYDPLRFVQYAFPWGKRGTILANETGPDTWQIQILTLLGEALTTKDPALARSAIRMAVASGHGVGKSALVAWIILWFISTRPNPQIVVTANTQTQLTGKTWRELSKWHKLAINWSWFQWTATQFKMLASPSTWFAQAVPWSEHNSEAFAGTHESHVLMLFDEASAVADIIWETAEGSLTTGAIDGNTTIWIAFGNPTRNSGRFRQCWTKFRRRWITLQVDSRTAKKADQRQIQEWIDDYGEDSDFVRVRVRGMFPRVGATQFIGNDLVGQAVARIIDPKTIPATTPKIMGVDVARQGDDESVIVRRRGRRMHPEITRLRIPDLMEVAARVAHEINEWRPDICFVDATGMGAGVFDRLVQLGYDNVVAVYVGEQNGLAQPEIHYNRRIECWARMKEWLKSADIPENRELMEELIGPEYTYDQKMKMRLERKKDMKKRGLPSPDTADALSLTFAYPVPSSTDKGELLEPEVA